jgi:PHD/YefM family antitoxin component YafN of YafNO toxin-antitoxin module
MNIKPSAAIRKNYNDIAELCRATKEPVYLTKNGEGDLVVMDLATYLRRESMLRLREDLLAAEEDRRKGKSGRSVKTVAALMRKAVQEITKTKNN